MARLKIWKDALHRGTWVTTKGQVFRCDRACLSHFRKRTRDMLDCGACIPWTFEHQHDTDDTTHLSASDLLARWAKNTGGHIHDVRLLSPDGPLEVLIDVDEQDVPTLEALKFCSPDIRPNWRDRNGPEVDDIGPYWPGQSIAHLAATPIPIQYPQRPFQFDKGNPLALSACGMAVCLSAATYEPEAAPERKIVKPAVGKDGLFKQPKATGPERERDEQHNRDRFGNHFHYADAYSGSTRTYDEKGDYNCGRCNMADGDKCLLVDLKVIDRAAGSCADWENTCAGDAEMPLHLKSATEACYGIAENGKGFGCARCPYASKAHAPDSLGRDLYCGKGDFRVFPTACCSLNGAPVVPIKENGEPKRGKAALSAGAVGVSLSSANKKDPDMPPKPDEKPEDDKPEGLGEKPEEEAEGGAPDEIPGIDLEGGGSITEPVTTPEAGDPAAKAVMHDLADIATELGVELHSSAHEDLLTFVQHFATAVKTHLATKKNGGGEPEPEQPHPQDQVEETANYQEPEVAESPPIQMSASTTPNPTPAAKPQVSAREQKLAQAVLKTNSANLMGRIANLHGRGFIDDTIRKEWEAEVGAIKLSASDVSDDGAIKPSGVALKIAALERVAKTGKPGSFAKPSTKPAPAARQNKPISTAVALSAAEEEVLDPPYGGEETENRPLNHSIVDRLSGGRYGAYRAKQQAENGAA